MSQNGISNYTLSLSEAVVRYIEDKILSGDMVAGDKINEYAISSELNISRAPIREAISELQVAGIIEHKPRKSGLISVFTKEDVDEIFDIRISLEKDIIRRAVVNNYINKEHIEHMKKLAENMMENAEKIDESSDVFTLNKLDLEFHTYLWDIAKSPRRSRMLHNIFMQLIIALNQNKSTLGKIADKAKEHMEYISALENKDISKAQDILEKHLTVYKKELYTKVYNEDSALSYD